MSLILAGILTLAFLSCCFALYKIVMSPELRYHSFWYKVKAWLVFNLGHIRRLGFFPFFTSYGYDVHKMTFKDARIGTYVARPGDIGIHRDEGFFSNLAIPGGFKHAWVFIDNYDCVEAVAEGVLRRDSLTPTYSDYVVILRPIGTTKPEVDSAVNKAKNLVGCEYDANFKFDFEQMDAEYEKYTKNITAGGFHAAFSCTETAAFSWYHCKDKLGIFRSMHAGREAVIADDFLRFNFGIVWMSPTVTLEWAQKSGMHSDAVARIKGFLDGYRDFNEHGNPVPRHKP